MDRQLTPAGSKQQTRGNNKDSQTGDTSLYCRGPTEQKSSHREKRRRIEPPDYTYVTGLVGIVGQINTIADCLWERKYQKRREWHEPVLVGAKRENYNLLPISNSLCFVFALWRTNSCCLVSLVIGSDSLVLIESRYSQTDDNSSRCYCYQSKYLFCYWKREHEKKNGTLHEW